MLLVGSLSRTALGAPGDLDPAFGVGGIAKGPAGLASIPTADVGTAIALQSDGRVIVAAEGATHDFLVRRYTANGTPDPGFGAGGSMTINFGGDDVPYAAAIQSDGRIIVVGTSTLSGTPRAAVARLTTGGALDPTFGAAGKVVTSLAKATTGRSVALQTDDRILIAGETGPSFFPDAYVARYTAGGALDPSFGIGGVVVQSVGFWSDSGFALAVQPDGAILAGGLAFLGGDYGEWFLLRLLSGGALDPDFGVGGIVKTDIGGSMLAAETLDIVVQPDGYILAGGSTGTTLLDFQSDFAIARYEADGDLDPFWGTGGVVITPVLTPGTAFTVVHALALQPDGSVLAVGGGTTDAAFPAMDLVVARYLADGSLDDTWGGDGLVTVDAPFWGVLAADAALQPDGRLLIAARDTYALAALRLVPGAECGDGLLDPGESCDDGNSVDGDCCTSACTVDPDGASCSDGDACTMDDACSAGTCTGAGAPATSCRAGLKGTLAMTRTAAGHDTLSWAWRRGAATSIDEIPVQHYTLCVYDASAAAQPIARLATGGPLCGTKPCFTRTSRRTTYSDTASASDGVRRLVLTSGLAGAASAQLVARGDPQLLSALPLVGSVTAQLHAESGLCWGATYATPLSNDAMRFRAKVD